MQHRKRPTGRDEIPINMTTMIDVTFLLLIFFIVTLNFRALEKKLEAHLPRDFGQSRSPTIVDDQFITLKLRQPSSKEAGEGWREVSKTRFLVEAEPITGSEEARRKAIFEMVDGFCRRNPGARGKIDVGTGVPHASVVFALDAMRSTGVESVSFVGLPGGLKPTRSEPWFQDLKDKLRRH